MKPTQYLIGFLLLSLSVACGDNPLGESNVDSEFGSGKLADTEPPTEPTNLSITGTTTLSQTPVLAWVASEDNKEVVSYQVGVGTSITGDNIFQFTDIGNLTTYQVSGIAPDLDPAGSYFFSVRATDEAGNTSDVASTTFAAPALVQASSAYLYPGTTYGVSCLEYMQSGYYDGQGDGLYWIDPDQAGAEIPVIAHCDMTMDGGGWTLVANRRGGVNNTETCGANLNLFFQDSCGSVNSIGYGDSYSIGDTDVRESLISQNEFLFLQKDNLGVIDSDDAFVIHHNTDLFIDSIGVLNRTAVTQICDINNANCDAAGAEFLWVGNGFFSSSLCSGALSLTTYFGNYGYCHNGSGGYNANSLFGDRDGYDETKLWIYTPRASDFYQEQIYIR